MFVVPTPRVPFGTCDQTYYYSSYWPGIDGNGGAGFNDVLQGGLEIAAICINGITSGYTIPWVEWYPAYSVGVSAPAMNPGDLVFVEVWNTSPTQGYVFFYNYSTDSSAEYSVTAPPGTVAYGSSVEWIVERPTVGNVLANLANYVASPWSERVAWNYANPNPTVYWMGATPEVGTIENLTMVDNTNQPISVGDHRGAELPLVRELRIIVRSESATLLRRTEPRGSRGVGIGRSRHRDFLGQIHSAALGGTRR